MQTITLELPDELITLAGFKKERLSQEALKLIVLELFREEVISLGKSAELCDISVAEFMEFAAARQVPLHYGEQELHQDREQFKSLAE